ncbi:hypothetical protein FEM48_Zijuj03G0176000 [Ziziphus jujuba var. spinosa]|uniref:Uncharacterized protein n=1 Tax=Ziziphus jujuba var. spinosa TaxID=714518 RepID=A0A978VRP6_ZIZJJ|nr:hypothetical protein FEM48_Zijuj03G0176000 [Ziziphus jujuba var. spinosa]
MMIMPRENNVVALMFGILALSTLGFYLEASVAEAKNKAQEPAVNSSIYIDASPCINFNSSSSSNSPKSYFYVLSSDSLVADINWDSCYVQVSYPATEFNTTGKTIVEICQHLLMGFSIYSDQIPCYSLTWKQSLKNVDEFVHLCILLDRDSDWFRYILR